MVECVDQNTNETQNIGLAIVKNLAFDLEHNLVNHNIPDHKTTDLGNIFFQKQNKVSREIRIFSNFACSRWSTV